MIDLQALELPLPVSDAASNIGRHGGIAPSRFSRLDKDKYFTLDSLGSSRPSCPKFRSPGRCWSLRLASATW
jgi:hypothetical protein